MTPFAFIILPITAKDAARKIKIAKYMPDWAIEALLRRRRPMVVSHVTGIRSKTGATTEGWFVGCPLTPKQMMNLPLEEVYGTISEAARVAADAGAKVVGLGAFTSVVGDGGITVAERAPIAVTTGNSYTVATAIQGTTKALRMIGAEPRRCRLAIVGATGSIGRTCALLLAPEFDSTVLIGRDVAKTQAVADEVGNATATTDFDALNDADAIITVTSAEGAVIEPEHLKAGCVVCDVARPRDVSVRVAKVRPDVLVIEGGVVAIPGDVDFGMNFGFPPKTAYACMSETIMLALEDRPESYTLGKNVSVEQVREMLAIAEKHGFELAGFRSFERAVGADTIARVRKAREALPVSLGSH